MSNPSLILPQSPAYGEDYVYAAQVYDGEVPVYDVLPLTFTRASGGSRINKDGLVQNMPYNLVEQSETFTNAYWYTNNVTINANAVTAPNGLTTAENAVTTASDSYISSSTSYGIVPLQTYTQSIYVKWVSGYENFMIRSVFFGGTGVYSELVVNARYGTFISCNNTYQIENAGNGWFRISQQLTNTDNLTAGYQIYPTVGITQTSVISIFGAQVNIGSTAQPYLATTDRLNMPRITYPVGGGCGALLLEKQSTNLVTYSEQFDQWSAARLTITANNTTSPDGTQNAEKLECNLTTTGGAYIGRGTGTQTTGYYTISTFAKKGNNGFVAVLLYDVGGANYGGALANLNDSTIALISAGNYSNQSCAIENVGNDWFRVSYTCNKTNGSYLLNAELYGAASSGNYLNVTAGQFNYLWGAQVEASSYATSYISTTSASSTRIADACYKTGISNLIGQTEGTLFCDFEFVSGAMGDAIIIRDSGYGTYIYINQQTSGNIFGQVQGVGNFSFSTPATNGRLKCAIAYKSGDSAFFVNGAQVGTTNTTTFTPNTMTIFEYLTPQLLKVYQSALYKTRLTNSELATLTTI